ncbi:unnamed protein product, partial [Effrenium voratum]
QASMLPLLLLLAALAAGWWLWSNAGAGAGAGGSSAGVPAPVPDAEELRRKRLEALQASMEASKAKAEAAAEAEAEGLRQRRAERAAKEAKEPPKSPKPESAPPAAPAPAAAAEPAAAKAAKAAPKTDAVPRPPAQAAPVAPPAPAPALPAAPAEPEAPAEALSVRVQSTLKGSTSAFVLEELSTESSVSELEALALGAFQPGEDIRPRLFFMGKELKDGAVPLGRAGLKPHQTSTVQVMFVAGSPRAPAVRPQGLKDAAAAPASAAAGGAVMGIRTGAVLCFACLLAAAQDDISVVVSRDVFDKQFRGQSFDTWGDFVEAAGEQNNPGGEARLKAGFAMLFAALATVTVGLVSTFVLKNEVCAPFHYWLVFLILMGYAAAVFAFCIRYFDDPAYRVVTNLLFGLVPWNVSVACYLLVFLLFDCVRLGPSRDAGFVK